MEEKQFDLSQLYIIDFVKHLIHKKNVFSIIYLSLNVLIITLMIRLFEPNFWLALLYGVLVYGVTATIALSPVGEWLFRKLHGCNEIQDPDVLRRLQPLFDEVKTRAKVKRPDIVVDDRIHLYITNSKGINAFALGRRTVCVTRGLLALSDQQIKAVLGHEFGHLLTHDTDLTLLISVGNIIVTVCFTLLRFFLVICNIFMSLISSLIGKDWGWLVELMNNLSTLIYTVALDVVMFLWTKLGILLVMKTSREAEFEADAFSCSLGYKDPLLSFFYILDRLESGSKKEEKDIFTVLASSHPETSQRIERIRSGGALSIER